MPDDDGIEAVGVRRKIGRAGNDAAQGVIEAALAFGIDSLDDHAARVAAAGKQHGQINRGRHAAHSVDVAQLFGERAVILDAFRAGPRQVDVRGDAEQAVLNRAAKARVHRQRNHQRGHARGDSDHGK